MLCEEHCSLRDKQKYLNRTRHSDKILSHLAKLFHNFFYLGAYIFKADLQQKNFFLLESYSSRNCKHFVFFLH